MLGNGNSQGRSSSLLNEYSSLLGDAVLRHRTKVAERTARLEAEFSNKVKSEFIANMSHELRTPLNSMIGFSKLMAEHGQRPLKSDEIVQYSSLIHDAAKHLLAIINDILEMSKIQSGKYRLDSRDLNLDDVLSSCIASFKIMASDAGVVLQHKIPPRLPVIQGDSVKLRQIFTNLISNAIKFTPKGGTVSVEAAAADRMLTVSVRDSGIGMTPDEVQVALTPFGQVDGSRSRLREGTGLGLPIAKALVELHDGKMEVRSEKDKGTFVLVKLPVPTLASASDSASALRAQPLPQTASTTA